MIHSSYNCGNEGHISRECPDGPKDTKSCYRCGQPGHISRDCPSSAGQGGQGGATECYKVSCCLTWNQKRFFSHEDIVRQGWPHRP